MFHILASEIKIKKFILQVSFGGVYWHLVADCSYHNSQTIFPSWFCSCSALLSSPLGGAIVVLSILRLNRLEVH